MNQISPLPPLTLFLQPLLSGFWLHHSEGTREQMNNSMRSSTLSTDSWQFFSCMLVLCKHTRPLSYPHFYPDATPKTSWIKTNLELPLPVTPQQLFRVTNDFLTVSAKDISVLNLIQVSTAVNTAAHALLTSLFSCSFPSLYSPSSSCTSWVIFLWPSSYSPHCPPNILFFMPLLFPLYVEYY